MQMAEHRKQLEALKEEESTILQGLGFFKIEQQSSKVIRMLEKVCPSTTLPVLNQTHYNTISCKSRGYWQLFMINGFNMCECLSGQIYKYVIIYN